MLTAVLMTAVAVMMMSVVITVRVGIIFQISFGERFRRFVSRTLDSSIKFDSGIGECHLRTHSDPTADQGVHFCCLQKTGQCTMSASVCIYNLFSYDPAVLSIIQFELL